MSIRQGLTPVLTRAAARFVSTRRVAHLATADGAGVPHVVPICFVFAGATLYTPIDRKPKRSPPARLRRIRNVTTNPRVAIVVDTYSEDWTRLGYVLLEGRAEILEQGGERARERADAIRRLKRKYRQYRTMDLDDRPVIAVQIDRAVTWGNRFIKS